MPSKLLVALFSSICLLVSGTEPLAIAQSSREPDLSPAGGTVQKQTSQLMSEITSRTDPQYPHVARVASIEDSVNVEVVVDEEGKVFSARARYGHALLKNAAVTAVRAWKFKPTLVNGVPRRARGVVTVDFELGDVQEDTSDELETARALSLTYPDSPEVHYWLGELYEDEDHTDEAIKAYKKAIDLKRDYFEAYSDLALLYKVSKQLDAELSLYKQAVEAIPASTDLMKGLASALANKKQYEEAVTTLKRVIEIDSEDFDSHNTLGLHHMSLRQYEKAAQAFMETVKLKPTSPNAFHNLGWAYHWSQKYEQAIEAYNHVATIDPKYSLNYRLSRDLGSSLYQLKRFAEAEVALQRALELKPDYADAHRTLGILYHQTSRLEEALEALKKGLSHNPGDAYGHTALGNLYGRMGKIEDAEKALREAIKHKPDLVEANINLARVLSTQGKIVDAESVLRAATRTLPDNNLLRIALASFLSNGGKSDEAEQVYREVLQAEPNNALVLNNLGYLLVERNEQIVEAVAMIQKAVDAQPDNPAFLDSLGWALFKLGKLDDAERYLISATQNQAQSPTIYEHLGDVYVSRGKKALARTAWQKALSLSVASNQIARIKAKLEPSQ
jgi:putative PEP-CTERM system TPR-repeat lipoprotein